MCGIVGVFHLDGQRGVDREVLRRMTSTIVHRGPDDEGFFADGPVGFGVRRLSIVDRAGGHQPLSGEDGSTWIAFNGEIYNHPELRELLLARGHRYRTNCDTETVVHAYEEFGEDMVQQLRGMFGFALWDTKRRRLLLYRDRLGIKPLYYAHLDNTLVFSSEVKALLEYGVPFRVEPRVVECYLRLGYVPGELTLFEGIRRLPPGHFLAAEVGSCGPQLQRYWTPQFQPGASHEDPAFLADFERLLNETVAQHRIGEVQQGIFLSGGVDSSSLLALNAAQVKEPVLTFAVGYREERDTSEFPYARKVAAQFGARHVEYELSGADFAASLPRLIWHMDDAVADPAAIPLFFISRLAREHITVVHSGEGADEILAGYSIYRRMGLLSGWQKVLTPVGASAVARALRLPGVPVRYRRYAEWLNKPLHARYQGVRRVLTEDFLRRAARDGFPSEGDCRYRESVFGDLFARSRSDSELNQMLFVDLQTWLPDDLLVKADKMTMAASIELRVPFLDHRVVEFAASLPIGLKLRNGQSKYLLKRLMRGRLPDDILDARKRGFPVPLAQWLRGHLYGAAREWLLDSPLLRDFLRPGAMENLLESHRAGKADFSSELYGLACLSIWHDVFRGASQDPQSPRAPTSPQAVLPS
ncbi:MAG: asparagine synthase (glutamine-hydrolyzing) [Verrucomicrobiales bacterium]|nr:asparagine synthase (glutamine-hydrolyzing) [Verrucomicrobiales bacterium]